MVKKFENKVINGYNGKPIRTQKAVGESGQVGIVDCRLQEILWLLLNNAPLRTQNDSIQGMRLAQALDKADGAEIIEIEEGVHDWLKPIAEQLTPSIFRVNGNLVYDLVKDGFIKAKEPTVGVKSKED